jgi:ornithine carbamoyltransferase
MDRYVDLLAMRVFSHDNLETIDAATQIPIVNLLSDLEHPCQSIADVMTLAENGLLTETTAFVGDGNNVCHSLMMAITMAGGSIRVATAPGFEPHPDYVEAAGRYGDVLVTNDVHEAVEGAAAVYTDVWASMGQEAEADTKKRQFERFRVDSDLFMRADPDAIFLHCLPAHRGEEVTDEVIDHPRSRVFDQAENRLHSFKAVLLDQLR